jgi:hypothetical protein
MSRLLTAAAPLASTIFFGVVLAGGTAHAQSQAEIAAKLNDEGKELMFGNKFAEAAKKFQEAVARVPEAKYFVNLCLARFQEGKFDEALTACNAVELNNPTEAVKDKAAKLIGKINEAAKAQNLELHPGGGGGGDPGVTQTHPTDPPRPDPNRPADPNRPVQPAGYTPTVGRPPAENLALAVTPDNNYTWTLGFDLFGGGGQIGEANAYGTATAGFRIKGDYILNPAARLGAQVYLQYQHLGQGKNDMLSADTLDVVDLGIAGYKHFCLGNQSRLCATPLVGAQLALMSPAGQTDGSGSQLFNYLAVGGRAEISLAYAFGRRFEHVLSLMAGVNAYTQVLQGPSAGDGFTAAEVGLDQGGIVAYLGLGYTHRFNTPLGSSPFVILE